MNRMQSVVSFNMCKCSLSENCQCHMDHSPLSYSIVYPWGSDWACEVLNSVTEQGQMGTSTDHCDLKEKRPLFSKAGPTLILVTTLLFKNPFSV